MRLWMDQITEAYEGERMLDQTITRNLQQYAQEAHRLKFTAGGSPQADYAQIKTAADLMRVLDKYIDVLAQSDQLKAGAAPVLLSRLRAQNLERGAQQLDQIARMPAPKQPGT